MKIQVHLQSILKQWTLLVHAIKLLICVPFPDFRLAHQSFLLVQPEKTKLQDASGNDASRGKSEGGAKASGVLWCLAIEVDEAANQTANVANTDEEANADGPLRRVGTIAYVPSVDCGKNWVHASLVVSTSFEP